MTAPISSRREMILDAAVTLFREKGFHGAGIDEIGAAAGISGPGVYRHFENKLAILVAMSDRVSDRLLVHNARVKAEEADPTAALGRLVRTQVAFAIGQRDLISVFIQERRNLPDADRQRLDEKQDRYIEQWVEFLVKIAPDARRADLRAVIVTVIGMIDSVTYPDAKTASGREVVEQMAMAALLTGGQAVSSLSIVS